MTKTEFVAKLAERHNLAPGYAEKILNALLASVEDALFKDGRIVLPGFGIFQTTVRSPRPGRNPVTGEALQIPSSRTVHFKASKALRELLD